MTALNFSEVQNGALISYEDQSNDLVAVVTCRDYAYTYITVISNSQDEDFQPYADKVHNLTPINSSRNGWKVKQTFADA